MTTNGYKVSLGSDKNVQELDGCGDGCTTLKMLKATELGALRWLSAKSASDSPSPYSRILTLSLKYFFLRNQNTELYAHHQIQGIPEFIRGLSTY